jgi:smad nuclear-interacting protein 1
MGGGEGAKQARPYLLDLQSSNKTLLNGNPIDDSRFFELREGDVLKFGFSTREYVLMREKS